MIDAQLLATPHKISEQESTDLSLYGVWIPRGGDNGRFGLEVVAVQGTDLTVEVFHKNYGDAGDGTAYDPGRTIDFPNKAGRLIQEWLGCKELVRFKFTLTAAKGVKVGEFGWVMFRFLSPLWFETVKA